MDGKRNVENQSLSEVCFNGFEHGHTRIEARALAHVVQLIGSLSHALEGHRFNSWLGTHPGCVQEVTNQYLSLLLVFISLSNHISSRED